MHVFVAGAGPVGLSAAVALMRRGHKVTIADRDDGVTDESRAVGVNRSSLTLLAPSGVGQSILEAGTRVRHVRCMSGTRTLARIRVPGQNRRWPTLVALPQSRTERFLEEALRRLGGFVIWRHRLTGIEEHADGVRARIAPREGGPERIVEADFALGADGSRSTTREALGIRFEGSTYPEDWGLADITCDWPFPDEACAIFGEDGRVTFMITLGEGRHRVIGNHADVIGAARRLMNVSTVHWSNSFHVHLRIAEEMGRGRVALAGDAAHTHSPVGGQGMNLGIEDAFAFADAVDSGDLAAYRKTRLARARTVVRRTDLGYRVVTGKSRLGVRGRNAFVRLVGGLSRLRS